MTNIFDITSNIFPLVFAMVAFGITMYSLEKYPERPGGTRFIPSGFLALTLAEVLIALMPLDNLLGLLILMGLKVMALACLAAGGVKFKMLRVPVWPLFWSITAIGVIVSAVVIILIPNQTLIISHYITAVALAILAISFLLHPNMEKTGGYVVTALSLLALAGYYATDMSSIGRQFMGVMPINMLICVIMVYGLTLLCGNVMWYQIEYLLDDVNKSKDRLKIIVQASPFPIIISNLKTERLTLINTKAAQMFALDIEHPGNFKIADYIPNKDIKKELMTAVLRSSDNMLENFEVLVRKTNSSDTFWTIVSCRIIEFEKEKVLYSTFQDITGRKEKEMKLFDQATKDPLTNCYNRRQFEELASKEVYKAKRGGNPFSLAMIDADHFKKVNDTYGHATGDIVLKALADCCRDTLRESDIIARYGGEEFLVLFPETPIGLAETVCERLRVNISNLSVSGVNGEKIKFTVSMGLAEFVPGKSINDIIKTSDEALYVAKQTGRNKVVLGTEDILSKNKLNDVYIPQEGLPIEENEEGMEENRKDSKSSVWDFDE